MTGRIALLVGVVAMMGGLYTSGFLELVSEPERAREMLAGIGLFGPLLYLVCFAFLTPFFFPSIFLMAPGALLWSFPVLLALSWLGAMLAAVVGFYFSRYVGRSWVEERLPPRFRAWDERLAESGLRTVILVRLTFYITPPGHWVLGLSKVSFPTFLLGTAIGLLPMLSLVTFVMAVLGSSLYEWLNAQPAIVWWIFGASVVALIVVRRRFARRSEKARVLGRDEPHGAE